MLRQAVEGADRFQVQQAVGATDEDLLFAHAPLYLERVVRGRLTEREVRSVGLPWSPEPVEHGAVVNLGGGTHHALPDRGRGYCTLSDAGVAVRRARADGLICRVLRVDLDVHQGGGTRAALRPDPRAVCMSVNGGANTPCRRVPGDVEDDLPDRSRDDRHLEVVGRLLPLAIGRARADLCIHLPAPTRTNTAASAACR